MKTPSRTTLALLVASLPVLAAGNLGVKPGLWETTTEINTAGIALPESVTANMSPQQKAQMEAMMKQMAAQGPRVVTAKSCVTAEDLKDGVFRAARQAEDQGCKNEVVSSTPSRQEISMTCSGQMKATGRMVLNVVDSNNVQGDMQITMQPSGGMNMKFKSRWLSASCAGADKPATPAATK